MNTPKSSSRKAAEIMVRDYNRNKRDLALIADDALYSTAAKPEVLISGKGRNGDDTFRRASMVETLKYRRMQEEVKAVQYAIGMCKTDKRNGDKIKTIIDLVYWKGTHTIFGAGQTVGIGSAEWSGKLVGRFFKWVNLWFEIGE